MHNNTVPRIPRDRFSVRILIAVVLAVAFVVYGGAWLVLR